MLTEEIKEVLRSNICHFATSSKEGKPNVIPVGIVDPVSNQEVMLADVRFNKTRKNLEENKLVALTVTDLNRNQAYQLKGEAELIVSGELYERVVRLAGERFASKAELVRKQYEEEKDPTLKEKLRNRLEEIKERKPKAAVLIKVVEVYQTL